MIVDVIEGMGSLLGAVVKSRKNFVEALEVRNNPILTISGVDWQASTAVLLSATYNLTNCLGSGLRQVCAKWRTQLLAFFTRGQNFPSISSSVSGKMNDSSPKFCNSRAF